MNSIEAGTGTTGGSKVRSGLSAGSPVNIVMGDRLPKLGRSEWFKMLWTKGSTVGHSASFMRKSESRARQARKISLRTVSTLLLDCGQ